MIRQSLTHMKIIIINSILRTPEKGVIPQSKSIKDSVLYNYALAFHNLGHNVTLIAAEEYMPSELEKYPFEIIFLKSNIKWIFKPDLIPLHLSLFKYLLQNKSKIDLVIVSEVFQLSTLIAALCINKSKLIFWQEMSVHQKKFFRLPSLIWHNFVAPMFLRDILVVPRSERAYAFIKKYLKHTSKTIVRHGFSLEKFTANSKKEDYVISASQLIERKNVGSIIKKFNEFISSNERVSHYKLLIAGDGNQLDNLVLLTNQLGIKDSVIFCGRLNHNDLNNTLGKAKCLLIDTLMDLAILTVSESIAVGTPIVSNTVIDNCFFINDNSFGIAKDNWSHLDIMTVIDNNDEYVENCIKHRETLSFDYYAKLMLDVFKAENPLSEA